MAAFAISFRQDSTQNCPTTLAIHLTAYRANPAVRERYLIERVVSTAAFWYLHQAIVAKLMVALPAVVVQFPLVMT
jgi:hypothetical protein